MAGHGQVVKLDPNAPIGCFKSQRHDQVAKMFRTLRDKKWFQTSIIIVIFLAGILVGIQTYDIQDPGIISVTECVGAGVSHLLLLLLLLPSRNTLRARAAPTEPWTSL